MSEKPLNVALIGTAFMGKAHSNGWRNVHATFDTRPIRMHTLVGTNPETTEANAKQYGWAHASTDWQAVVNDPDIDIVDICTPGYLHAEMGLAALKAGKNVIVEKPLANTLDEAQEMVAEAQSAARNAQKSMVAFNYRRVPALALAAKIIAEGSLGAVRQIRAAYLQDWLADPDFGMTWRLRKDTAGSGALGDLGSHVIDQLRFLTGAEITTASARLATFVTERTNDQGDKEPVTVDDAAWATLTLAGGHVAEGAIASVEVTRMATGVKNGLTLEIFGEKGALRFELERFNELQFFTTEDDKETQGFHCILVTEGEHPYLSAWWPPGHVIGWAETFTAEFADFLATIGTQGEASPSFLDGLKVQQVLAAIERSASEDSRAVAIQE